MSTTNIQTAIPSSVEHDILQIIAENPQISQRKIAEAAGISLGQANFLMKKFIKKGLVKIEGQTPKSLRYNLTPQGMKEKMELTLRYIKISYAAVIKLTDKISEITSGYKDAQAAIYVLDQNDEMTEIVKLGIDRAGATYQSIKDICEIDKDQNHVLMVWEDVNSPGIHAVNVLV